MKNKKKYILISVIVLIIVISFVIPIKSEKVWINDSNISDVGHYEEIYYNLYGIKIRGAVK